MGNDEKIEWAGRSNIKLGGSGIWTGSVRRSRTRKKEKRPDVRRRLKGVKSPAEIAQELGASPERVELISKLGTVPDAQLAEEYGLSYGIVGGLRRLYGVPVMRKPNRKRPLTPERVELISKLGTVPDAQLAEEYGVSYGIVGNLRRLYGVPVMRKPRPLTPERVELISKLGTVPDAQLAEEYGLSRERIRQLRVEHGIAIYKV